MSAEQVQTFLKLAEDAGFRQKFEAAEPEARRAILAASGLGITPEEALAALAGEGELSDQDLDQAAGAAIGVIRYP